MLLNNKKASESNLSDVLLLVLWSILFSFATMIYLTYSNDKTPVEFAWLIPVFPIVSFVIILLLGHLDPRKGGTIALVGVGFSSVFSIFVTYDVLVSNVVHDSFIENSRTWFSGSTFSFEFGTYIDSLAAVLLLVVGFVSYLVVLFSLGYMEEEGDRQIRYFAEISLFVGVCLLHEVLESFYVVNLDPFVLTF